MREYELVVDKALMQGLGPYSALPVNSQFLHSCLDVRCGRSGIEAYNALSNPLPAVPVLTYTWPFPRIIFGELYGILVYRGALADYIYTVSADHLTVTLIATIDVATYGTGWITEVADFGRYIFMVNGAAIVYYDVATGLWAITDELPTIPLIGTVCNFKGQAVGGNVVAANIFTSLAPTSVPTTAYPDYLDRRDPWASCDETYYIWSKIGSLDFTPDADGEAGFRRCPYGGEVYHTRRLGDSVVGYSSKGVTLLRPTNDPMPSFGFTEISDIGLVNRGAMNGNLQRQIYVGEDRVVREITGEGVKELGYQYLMEYLTGTIIVSYEPHNRDFYISNGTRTFLLSPFGMTEIQQHPSAVWRSNGVSRMLPDTAGSADPFIATWPFDFGYAGQKTNQTIEISANEYADAMATVDYLNSGVWATHSYSPINNQGIATVIASGEAFRFKVKFGSLNSGFKMSHIKSRYKMTDLRGIRGVYAPPLRGQ